MKKFWLKFFIGSFLLLSVDAFAVLRYRSEAEILSEKSEAIDFQFQSFSKTVSYDEEGLEIVPVEDKSLAVQDFVLKYSRGFKFDLEGLAFANYRSIKSDSSYVSVNKSGLECIGLEGKYLFFVSKKFTNTLQLHFKKAMYTNDRYSTVNPPAVDVQALGDDGSEMGINFLSTYYDKYFKYDFKFGYNKPGTELSSELLYKAEAIYNFSPAYAFAGLSGIYSLKNDPYTDAPINKPIVSNGDSRFINSINREKIFLFAGVGYTFGDFIIGLKGETILSGRSIDKGNTIALNIRWEKNEIPSIAQVAEKKFSVSENYFANGFVEKISTSGKMLKINIGSEKGLVKGTNVDIFNINDYSQGHPIASGTVIEIDPKWSIVKINKRFNQSPIQVAYLVKAY